MLSHIHVAIYIPLDDRPMAMHQCHWFYGVKKKYGHNEFYVLSAFT